MGQNADILNDKWELISGRFDRLKSVPKESARVLNASIAAWQDVYWSEQGPPSDLVPWQERYLKAAALLDSLAKNTVYVSDYTQTDDYGGPAKGPVVHLPPLLVTARAPRPQPAYVAPRPIIYNEEPYIPHVRVAAAFAPVGTVDVSAWDKFENPDVTIFERAANPSEWGGYAASVRPAGKGGLIAAMVAIMGTMYANKAGLL